MRALLGKPPLEPEIPFGPRLRMVGNDRQEERAIADLPADRLIPDIAAAQLALVKPHLDAGGAQRLGNGPRHRRILRCITQKYGLDGWLHDYPGSLRSGIN